MVIMMRQLTISEINKLASRKNVRKIAVENFLMSMGDNEFEAIIILGFDRYMYDWNHETVQQLMTA